MKKPEIIISDDLSNQLNQELDNLEDHDLKAGLLPTSYTNYQQNRSSNFMKIIIIILSIIFSFNSFAHETVTQAEAIDALKIKSNDIILGNKNALVTVIEYSSLTCPGCSYFHQNLFEKLRSTYIDTGKVKYIHRDFPLDKVALKGSVLAHCAGADKYYLFLKVLFNQQSSWAFDKKYMENLENIGKLGGLDGSKIQACFDDKNLENLILDSRLAATNLLKLNSTPTFFINDKKIAGVPRWESFTEIIDNLLPKSTIAISNNVS